MARGYGHRCHGGRSRNVPKPESAEPHILGCPLEKQVGSPGCVLPPPGGPEAILRPFLSRHRLPLGSLLGAPCWTSWKNLRPLEAGADALVSGLRLQLLLRTGSQKWAGSSNSHLFIVKAGKIIYSKWFLSFLKSWSQARPAHKRKFF